MNINTATPINLPGKGITGDADSVSRSRSEAANAERNARQPQGADMLLEKVAATRPEGSDPVLWESLSAAEQDYFAALETIGSLTYGPGETSAPRVAPLGQRLDVRA